MCPLVPRVRISASLVNAVLSHQAPLRRVQRVRIKSSNLQRRTHTTPVENSHRRCGRCSKNMTAPSATSPPVSPPAKRVKTDNAAVGKRVAESTTLPEPVPATMDQQMPPLLVKKLSDKARLPTRGSAFAAGYDLYAARDTVVPARGKILVDTDISMAVPAGTYGRIAPRSGLASKHFIDTGAGVIDADYRGQVKVLLFNHGASDFEVKEGDRIAQLVLEKICTPDVQEVEELEESVRGAGGFGSTG